MAPLHLRQSRRTRQAAPPAVTRRMTTGRLRLAGGGLVSKLMMSKQIQLCNSDGMMCCMMPSRPLHNAGAAHTSGGQMDEAGGMAFPVAGECSAMLNGSVHSCL
jgi:hypothetical protein